MNGVDLQIHTTYSDGKNTPSEVVHMAYEHGVGIMAVTDHDNVGGVAEALVAGKKENVTVIPGVEITTSFHGKSCHILGYGIDSENKNLKLFLDPIYHYRRENVLRKLEIINGNLKSEGKVLVDVDVFQKKMGSFYNMPMTAEYLVEVGVVENQKDGAELLRKAATPMLEVSPRQAIEAIHAAGGVAVVSHPFAPKLSFKNIEPERSGQEKLLKELIAAGLDGIECYQSGYDPVDTEFSLELAKKHKLLVSGGSDWHGSVHDMGDDIKTYIPFYPDHIGSLGITIEMVAPLLERLNIPLTNTNS